MKNIQMILKAQHFGSLDGTGSIISLVEKPVMLGSVEKLKQAVVSAERKFVKGITKAR